MEPEHGLRPRAGKTPGDHRGQAEAAKKVPKVKGTGEEPTYTGNVIDLMSALKQSLEKDKPGRKKKS
ncbi:non-homologous end joining protein Ku [Sinorhizobium terangae]|uniref:hypothetical protein n=1 Tax=Sinorhizobium terangae TaxID=110322 RepID=UPI001815BD30|nr:hypothetical protein [Sinorhizobium terangae]MBB4188423.1 non-homologous end joining protein Ku [Sinorhizobium terangae]